MTSYVSPIFHITLLFGSFLKNPIPGVRDGERSSIGSLNKKTIRDAYPFPNITKILDRLGSAKYFSVFDLASGFQIPMHESDAPKIAFSTPYGHYQFKRMPFGLKNAPATFQRLMDQILSGLQETELFIYLDDIVLYASSL